MFDSSSFVAGVPTGLWIDGSSTDARTGRFFPVIDPATGNELTSVADAGAEDACRALDSAAAVQGEWAGTAPRERSRILRSAWELVIERADELAGLITAEMGKALDESCAEIAYGAEFLRWFSEEAVRIQGRYTSSPSGAGRILVHKVPVGPCLAITPWNFPLAMATRKIAPALAAGCTMIVKPAAETPLTMLTFARIMADAGLPAGVLSVLPTTDPAAVSTPLFADPRLRKVTFTGSTPVGRHLIEQSARNVLRTSMELGGNAPFIVFDDADIGEAVAGAMVAKLRNGGEACTAANRFIVSNTVRAEFTTKLTERFGELVVGPGHDQRTDIGPLISAKQRDGIEALVRDAVTRGAQVLVGGSAPDGPGYYFPPTILDRIPANARILQEEIFGPVATITGFDTEAEAIALANGTPFGLAAYFYTQDLNRALRVAEALESGMVGINRGAISDVAAPFGGMKHSGFGSEGGVEGIEEYLETKYVALP